MLRFPETYGRLPNTPFPFFSCLIAALVAADYMGTQSLYNSSSSLYQFSIQTNLRVGKSEMAWDALFFLLVSFRPVKTCSIAIITLNDGERLFHPDPAAGGLTRAALAPLYRPA